MKVSVTFNFKVQRASVETSEQTGQPLGILEVMDADGLRQGFAKTQEEAVAIVQSSFDDVGIFEFDTHVFPEGE